MLPVVRCSRFVPSTAIVCSTADEATCCATEFGRPAPSKVPIPKNDGSEAQASFRSTLEEASKAGTWCILEIGSEADAACLREALHKVWLRYTWSHHEEFRLWIAVAYVAPADLPRWAESTGRFLLSTSSIFRRFCDSFASEFKVRELVSAVLDGHVFAVAAEKGAQALMRGRDVVRLFAAAETEDTCLALVEGVDGPLAGFLAGCRDDDGTSLVDVAVRKDFRKCAVQLRNLGCRSETFNFELLLDEAFEPLFDALLDPTQPLPFDAVRSCAVIASAGRWKVLRRLFDCRVDVDFSSTDYPLAEACSSDDMAVVHTVVDRMSATGVHPFRTGTASAQILVRMLGPDGPVRGQQSNAATRWTLSQLAAAVADEDLRIPISAPTLEKLRNDPPLMQALLEIADIEGAEDPASLVRFFARFDPRSAMACRVSTCTVNQLVRSAGDVDDAIFQLAVDMIHEGAAAVPMLRALVGRAMDVDAISLTRRSAAGATLLMEAVAVDVANDSAASCLIDVAATHRVKERFMEQIDHSGNNALARLVVQCSQSTVSDTDACARCAGVLVGAGCSHTVSAPSFSSSLFEMAARSGSGDLAFELLPVAPKQLSLITSTTTRTQTGMVLRGLRQRDAGRIDTRLGASGVFGQPSFPLDVFVNAASFLSEKDVGQLARACTGCWFAALASQPSDLPVSEQGTTADDAPRPGASTA